MSLALAVFVLPYLAVTFINGPSSCMAIKEPDLEDCLIWMVRLQSEDGIEKEALKAETVIARSNFYQDIQEGVSLWKMAGHLLENAKEREIHWIETDTCKEICRVIDETRGQILTQNGGVCQIPYHFCSGGRTRSGQEAFYDQAYNYLQSVDSQEDRTAPNYLTAVYLDKSQFPVEIEIKEQDSAGYVTEISLDGKIVAGEEFRQEMGLPSGNFSIQKLDETVRILCKGQGHGVGYSQYGGNALAEQGADYLEILNVYFPGLNVENHQEFLKKM